MIVVATWVASASTWKSACLMRALGVGAGSTQNLGLPSIKRQAPGITRMPAPTTSKNLDPAGSAIFLPPAPIAGRLRTNSGRLSWIPIMTQSLLRTIERFYHIGHSWQPACYNVLRKINEIRQVNDKCLPWIVDFPDLHSWVAQRRGSLNMLITYKVLPVSVPIIERCDDRSAQVIWRQRTHRYRKSTH